MNLLRLFFPKKKILLRCNYCGSEVKFSIKLVQQLEYEYRDDSVCPPKTECHYCHMGFVIPINYLSKNGKTYKFDELAAKIPTLDQDSFLDRLLDDNHF
jgi:hypothetical protein